MQMNLNHSSIVAGTFLPAIYKRSGGVRDRRAQKCASIAPLRAVLTYTHAGVVERFRSEFGLDKEESLRIFRDLLRWLWLNAIHTVELEGGVQGVPEWLGIRAEQLIIDEMWHTFLLYTDDYRTFCQTYFGFVIGHSPNDKPNEVLPASELEAYLMSYLTYVEKHLGTDTVFRWFDEYGDKYSVEKLFHLRIQRLQENLKSCLDDSKGQSQ